MRRSNQCPERSCRHGKRQLSNRLPSLALRHARRIAPWTISITSEHALTAAELDWDHGDPFDRLIAAQALIEGATLITADTTMQQFEPLNTLW
ncbi:type II toxin-antitoxin system VapC family toxin [Arthrobacter castelli]|uniref:type II toxin-antitoxin system VapC family toxin n=1 Tax=Arthrobacter castelli TaxID=271431 RepID=UPI0009D71E17|nr:type II toxin-antitoxin system VapC family toxin [Arthrobacter castelli]